MPERGHWNELLAGKKVNIAELAGRGRGLGHLRLQRRRSEDDEPTDRNQRLREELRPAY
jgi:hypothetical protein